ncbi:hypothetical protein P153DRAFT_399682 [Dothidotthia symphoricarpi CBS 119687]|uniref:Sensor histidine kinase-like protein/response regulator n=1 Tax=Dothidotthia symphoricarpi CBS 119687 TaxID=1392245 RepID=A0A6A6A347_9PLEO|nr:uncharacterized protein P153DRAFT_399682 [Dothidotthia symphoricarpi CBS 119687]KAF2126230.1 hypothetical protein P153DRAFT_399682 [Dothidotthia symphoricarpi CBS 119687]
MTIGSDSNILRELRTEYALNTYLQLFADDAPGSQLGSTSLHDALNDLVELAIVRIGGVCGAFVVLTDGCSQKLIASGETTDLRSFNEDGWLWLFQQTIAVDTSTDEKTFSVPVLCRNSHTSALTSVSNAPHLSFYAGTPIVSKKNQHVGTFFVVDNSGRTQLSAAETKHLTTAARKCISLLDFARERGFHNRWSSVQKQLDLFVKSRAMATQAVENSPTLAKNPLPSSPITERTEIGEIAEHTFMGSDDLKVGGEESERLVRAEIERDKRIDTENVEDTRTSTAKPEDDGKSAGTSGETAYRKVFRRAAQCLQTALEADGVLFVDGLIGLHGGSQPIPEPVHELEKEVSPPEDDPSQENGSKGERTYTSTEFRKGVIPDHPAEVLSMLTNTSRPPTTPVSKDVEGLVLIDESFLQRLMLRYPHGVVWYLGHATLTRVSDEVLVAEEKQEMIERLRKSFPGAKQLIFQPLSDPTSLKRLAGCFLWRAKALPPFTDRVDLPSLNEFLHTVEAEIARVDAMAAVKQQDAFVSSVSHELRTPLHGILGALQLLDDTDMDPLQKSLVNTITSCGSTLHETLTSVLSYAQINQFERRQHKYRQRQAPDAVWALKDKRGFTAGPDRDFQGLYICTNVAMLCEETVGVLEAGQSFSKSGHSEKVIVVCDVSYSDNWSFHTEPGALRRIASNLIGNALKYTAKGSVLVKLSASQTLTNPNALSNDLDSDRTMILTVKDTGRGMSKEFLDNHLFVPFTQEDATSSQGVGLGMSIVKSLVSLLNGEIVVQSEVGKGTEMTVRIPMKLYSDESDGDEQLTVEAKHTIAALRSRNLSVVMYGFPDFVRDSLRMYLCDWYHARLIDAADDAKPDIILFDEGSEQEVDTVRRTAAAYGQHGVLLSIVMTPSKLAGRYDPIPGYSKWERVPRPLGPTKFGKALSACVTKMDELRKGGADGADKEGQESEEDDKTTKEQQHTDEGIKELPYRPGTHEPNTSEGSDSQNKAPCSTTTNTSSSASASRSALSKKPASATPTSPSSQLRVLLVDDNALNLRLLCAFLKKKGYQNLTEAENGEKAVEKFRIETFDLIFMDISMPVMDGFEATRQIRSAEAGRQKSSTAQPAVVVALTGLASEKDEEDAFDAGVDFYMTKPVRFNELSALLKRCEEGELKK